MEFEWDEAKASSNLKKHGIDFTDAILIFADINTVYLLNETMNYGEERFKAIGLVKSRVLVVICVERRDDRIRLISARKATNREEVDYFAERRFR